MKKLIALLLLTVTVFSLTSCSRAIIYEEEQAITRYVTEVTEGYTKISPRKFYDYYFLHEDEKGLTVKLRPNAAGPYVSVYSYDTMETVTEYQILQVSATRNGETATYGTVSSDELYFDPYRNDYVSCMQVYQKSDTEYRVLFYVLQDAWDFYPVTHAMTSETYDRLLKGITDYMAEDAKIFRSEEELEAVVDYVDLFTSMYEPYVDYTVYFNSLYGSKFASLQQAYCWVPSDAISYDAFYDTVFPYCGFYVQDARAEYEKLGYTGYQPDMIIVPLDFTVGENLTISLAEDEIYYATKTQAMGYDFAFTVSPLFS